jgi:hypothetical protein
MIAIGPRCRRLARLSGGLSAVGPAANTVRSAADRRACGRGEVMRSTRATQHNGPGSLPQGMLIRARPSLCDPRGPARNPRSAGTSTRADPGDSTQRVSRRAMRLSEIGSARIDSPGRARFGRWMPTRGVGVAACSCGTGPGARRERSAPGSVTARMKLPMRGSPGSSSFRFSSTSCSPGAGICTALTDLPRLPGLRVDLHSP